MNTPLKIRVLTPANLQFADSLRAIAGWNQTMADWERFLAFDPQGSFIAEFEGAPAGVVTTISYKLDLAWIGMALVHPEYRRRGVGQALLERAIAYLQGRGVRVIKLDATPLGQPTYRKLGFVEELSLTRWEGKVRTSDSIELAPWEIDPSLDRKAFGASRSELLCSLANGSRAVRHPEGGYGMLRPGSRAYYLGPVIADSREIGLALIHCLLHEIPDKPVFWDIFDTNIDARECAQANGFSAQRNLTRMRLGPASSSGQPELQWAIAGPEVG